MTDYSGRPDRRPCLAIPDCPYFAVVGTDECLMHAKPVADAEQRREERYHGSMPTRPAEAARWHEPDQVPARGYDEEPTVTA